MADLEELFSQIEDQPVPGGCDQCGAYQTVTVDEPGIFRVIVHHDSWCPFFKARKAEGN